MIWTVSRFSPTIGSRRLARSSRVWTSWVWWGPSRKVSSTAVSRTGCGWLQFPEENIQTFSNPSPIVLLGLTTAAWPELSSMSTHISFAAGSLSCIQ